MSDTDMVERASLAEQIAAVRSLIDATEVTAAGFRKWVTAGNFPALHAALATLEAQQWRDIAEAPKDGTFVLAWCGDRVRCVHWHAEFEYRWEGERDWYEGAWTDHAVESFGYRTVQKYDPTHYRTLPPPPERAEPEPQR